MMKNQLITCSILITTLLLLNGCMNQTNNTSQPKEGDWQGGFRNYSFEPLFLFRQSVTAFHQYPADVFALP